MDDKDYFWDSVQTNINNIYNLVGTVRMWLCRNLSNARNAGNAAEL